ncbi:MAG: helix-turn-helix transcriptional regulator [Rhodobacterales bacterium]
MPYEKQSKESLALIAIILMQAVCALFFLTDVIDDAYSIGWAAFGGSWPLRVEALAVLALFLGIGVEARYLMQLLRRQSRIERGLSIASGALHELMEEMFSDWKLTPAEQDVAGFTLKGYSIRDVAKLRGSRDGTIKAQLNAIYRKAGVENRGQLVSLLIEDLMGAPLMPRETAA